MTTQTFSPRLESHFDLSALATEISEPVLHIKMKQNKPKYSISISVGQEGRPSAFNMEIYRLKNTIYEGTKIMKKLVHETVANLLSGGTDVKLSTIGVSGSDGNLSPDYIDVNKSMVIELTTTTNSDPKNVEDRFIQKINHYKDALTNTGYSIGVLVVGESFVYSNLAMSQKMVDALCQRCRIGIAVKSTIERYLGYSLSPDDTTEEETMVENIIRSMNKLPKSSKEFPLNDIIDCTTKPSRNDFLIANKILRDELKTSKKKSPEGKDLLTEYLNSYTGKSRTDNKRVSNIPFIEPYLTDYGVNLTNHDIHNSNMPLFLKKIWIASLSVSEEEISSKEDMIKMAMETKQPDDENKHKVQKHCAFNVKLDHDDLEEASTTGLYGKAQKSAKKYRDNKQKNKMSFHPLHTDTNDIEEFITKVNLMTESFVDSVKKPIKNLIRNAKSVWASHKSSSISELMFGNITKTRMVGFTSLITRIFTEICYCYKYWIGRSDFYVKKMDSVNLLIRCTGTHIFVAMAFPKSYYSSFDTGRLGPTLYESEEWYFSDVSSFTEPVVEHFVKSGPYITSLIAHQMCSMELPMDSKPSDSIDLSKDMNGILLLFLNNKTDAEEIMTSQRYLTMSVLEDLDPNPYRFVERLPEFIKSRLSAYLVKRTSVLMQRYSVPPIRMLVKEGENSVMEYDGLVGFFSNSPISFRRKIEEFYFGYVISKEKGRGNDRNFKIMKKIVQQEYKYRDNNYPEFSRTTNTKTNQSNIPVIKVLCYLMKERMKETYGSSWKLVMEKKIIERLSRISFSELATLKVSSRNYEGSLMVPHVDNSMTTEEIKEKLTVLNPDDVASRPRVMESLTTLIEEFKKDTGLKDVTHIIQVVPWCLNKIKNRGYFYSDIFPKPQHGGDREIHVLEITMRVCQLYVEHISRALCDMTPSDTLMHPKWKSSFVKTHYDQAENELDTYRITVGKSADAAKWCQRNHASKFAAILANFLPSWMVASVLHILSFWTNKVICFPIQFVANFLSNKSVKSNPVYERMRDEFYAGTGIFSRGAISNRMTIKSGMMQGILHYTSSFMHGVIQEAMIMLQSRVLRHKGIRSVITMAQGSDDSAELLSVCGKTVKTLIRAAVTMLHWKENLSKHIGIYTSRAKSCIGSSDMIEYNSEWYTRKNSIMPTFRWVSACLEVGIVEKFIDRLHNFYGTSTNVIEAGGKILETAVIQECQAWMHYIMIGLDNNPLAEDVSKNLIYLQDPALGYFPLDSDCNAGVTGVDFQLYKYHRDANYGFGVGANRLNKTELEMFEEDTKDPTVAQSLRRIRIKFGNHKIFENLLRRMSAPELSKLVEEVEEDPSILYYPPREWNKSKLGIFMKLFEPGVKESLSRHSATARIMSASAYMINRPCFIRSGTEGKVSLYKAILLEMRDRLLDKSIKLTSDEIFLYNEEYEDTLRDIEKILEHSVFQKVTMRSRSKQTIQIFNRVLNDIPVIEMCKEKWFGSGRTGLTLRQFGIKWADLKRRFKFLADSRTETKINLNMSEVQLKNFLVSIDSRPRKLTLMDTSARGSGVKSTMTRLFWPNIKLLRTGSDIADEETASSLRSKIFAALTHWSSKAEKRKYITDLLSKSDILTQRTVPARLKKTKCIFDVLNQVPNHKIMDNIISEKIGSLGIFTIRQSGFGSDRTGYGEWKGLILSSNVKIELHDQLCTRITLSNMSNKSELGKSLIELLKNIKCKFPSEPTDSDHWLTQDGTINGGRGAMCAIPIEIDNNLKVSIFDDALEWEWFVDFSYNCLRIRANMGQGGIVTILSDSFKSYEWDPIYSIDDSPFRHWNNSEPMNAEDIGTELSSFFNHNDSTTLKELARIRKNDRTSVSSSGWQLSEFSKVLKTFFSLRCSDTESCKHSKPEDIDLTLDISDEDLMFFQTGDFEIDDEMANELNDDDTDIDFDPNFSIEEYLDDNLEMLLMEREVAQQHNPDTMPPTNRCLSSLDGLSRALTNMSLQELYSMCVQDERMRFSGLMGKIMTLVTETPRVKREISDLERNALRQEEDAISATMSLRTIEDLGGLDEKELKDNINEIDLMLTVSKQASIRDSLLQTRTRYLNMLNLIDIKQGDNSVSKLSSRDIILWLRDESGYTSKETNMLFRLSDSAYILALRDRLDNHVETMCKNSLISEYELGLYRESIPKPHLTTLFLDVFSSYLGIDLKVGEYYTHPDGIFDFEFTK